MLAAALEGDVNDCIAELADQRDENGRRLVVRNGYHRPRSMIAPQPGRSKCRTRESTTSAWTKQPASANGSPRAAPGLRRSATCCRSYLYLHGLSSVKFVPGLEQFPGS
ncbi:hypothetical protein GCM10010278_86010 [Streptomyces melanogenes]|nr:hypothetical protein GCM10010278_86010 [Streptomyces melanogenes]